MVAAAYLIFLECLQAANEENLATPPFEKNEFLLLSRMTTSRCDAQADEEAAAEAPKETKTAGTLQLKPLCLLLFLLFFIPAAAVEKK